MNLERQPIINIGMLGCVSEGKSTTVYKLTNIKTQKHSKELKKNITIKPGYANLKIYKKDKCVTLKKTNKCINHLSFIDCPGHHMLIQTMLGNINLMDGVIIVIAVNTPLQTKNQLIEHLLALKLTKISDIIIILNKLDLVSKSTVVNFRIELDKLLFQLDIKPKVIIPACLNMNLGLDYILHHIVKFFKPKSKNKDCNSRFYISRSFDINKSNINLLDLNGGVIGGSLTQGNFKIGDEIEIKPGIIINKIPYSLKTKIISLKSDNNSLDYIYPGGLIGIGTTIDPYYCKNDFLTGQLCGHVGFLPDNFTQITIKIEKNDNNLINEWIPKIKDIVNLQISTKLVKGQVSFIKNNYIVCLLSNIICIDYNTNILITDNNNNKIIGFGIFIENENNIVI
uniref:Elongation factor Tu GTP binding domain protein n=1 Tax=Megaviridae environmental sample TaxID=1737588 RepID=A0A5J6VJE5_9VIRU|nr:MAG: elongation factor Tu GTP binding domain protein [Megaviridae environmental sample]